VAVEIELDSDACADAVPDKPTLRHSGLSPASSAAEPDCVCWTADANDEGGAQRDRHGWRESIGLAALANQFRVPSFAQPRNDKEMRTST
jgi:hypothetical protein